MNGVRKPRLTSHQHEVIARLAEDASLSMLEIALEADCSKGTVQRLLAGRQAPRNGRSPLHSREELERMLAEDVPGTPYRASHSRVIGFRRSGYASENSYRKAISREKRRNAVTASAGRRQETSTTTPNTPKAGE